MSKVTEGMNKEIKIMFKIGIVTLFLLFVGISLIISFENKTSPQTKVHDYSELSPTEVVKVFWQAAVEGDEEVVRKTVTITPESFNQVCEETNKSSILYSSPNANTNNKSGISLTQEFVDKLNSESNTTDQSFAVNNKFIKESTSDSKLSLAYITARNLYANKIPLSKVNIIKEEIYKDEAIVQLEYSISNNYKIQENFFLTNQGGWKFFLSASPNSVVIGNINYAKLRPQCEILKK